MYGFLRDKVCFSQEPASARLLSKTLVHFNLPYRFYRMLEMEEKGISKLLTWRRCKERTSKKKILKQRKYLIHAKIFLWKRLWNYKYCCAPVALTCPSFWRMVGQDFLKLKYNAGENQTGLLPPTQNISEVTAGELS